MKRSGPLRRSSSLERSGPLRRGAPLRSTGTLQRSGRLRPRSSAKRAEMSVRSSVVAALVAAGVRCEVGPVLRAGGIDVRCAGRIGGLHERRKRSAGGSLENPANLVPACNPCNAALESLGDVAIEEASGSLLVVRCRHDEWGALGERGDGELVAVDCEVCGGAWVRAVAVGARLLVPCCGAELPPCHSGPEPLGWGS